jgi:hypothetical protein
VPDAAGVTERVQEAMRASPVPNHLGSMSLWYPAVTQS